MARGSGDGWEEITRRSKVSSEDVRSVERRVGNGVDGYRRESEVREVQSCEAVPLRHCLKSVRVSDLTEEEVMVAAAAAVGA